MDGMDKGENKMNNWKLGDTSRQYEVGNGRSPYNFYWKRRSWPASRMVHINYPVAWAL